MKNIDSYNNHLLPNSYFLFAKSAGVDQAKEDANKISRSADCSFGSIHIVCKKRDGHC